jgi:hypothetical protein
MDSGTNPRASNKIHAEEASATLMDFLKICNLTNGYAETFTS